MRRQTQAACLLSTLRHTDFFFLIYTNVFLFSVFPLLCFLVASVHAPFVLWVPPSTQTAGLALAGGIPGRVI